MKLQFKDNNSCSCSVRNHKDEHLGEIIFDTDWKCFVWLQDDDVKMSEFCLQQVVNRLHELSRRM